MVRDSTRECDPSRDAAAEWRRTLAERMALTLLFGLLAGAWWATAWVSDDAFITLRTVDNALAGEGWVWNPGERVQAYTHPLWFLLLLVATAPHGDAYAAALAAGALCTALAVFVLVARIATARARAALVLGALLGSRAFVDYASAGLENPLVHLGLVALAVACLRPGSGCSMQTARIAFASLVLLTRLDLALAIGPLLVFAWRRDGLPSWRAVALGALPLAAWETFSLLYYGDWMANSARAKLAAGIPIGDRCVQGVRYLLAAVRDDPLSALLLSAGAVVGLRRGGFDRALAVALVGHLGWVVWVGGDFMAGRFLTPAIWLAALVVARWPLSPRAAWAGAAGFAAAALAVPVWSPFAVQQHGEAWHAAIDDHGIADERSFHRETTSLRSVLEGGGWRTPEQRDASRWTREHFHRDPWIASLRSVGVIDEREAWPPADDEAARGVRPVLVKGGVGLLGFRLGPQAYLIDYHALGDPLLSRLPALPRDPVLANLIPRLAHLDWRVGHYLRPVPEGYVLSCATDENRIADPDLAALYDRIRLVTRGRLWSRERLAAIVALHSGRTQREVARYVGRSAVYRAPGSSFSARRDEP